MAYSYIFVTQITRKQKYNRRQKNNITEQKIIACWWKYKNIKSLRFSKL